MRGETSGNFGYVHELVCSRQENVAAALSNINLS